MSEKLNQVNEGDSVKVVREAIENLEEKLKNPNLSEKEKTAYQKQINKLQESLDNLNSKP